MSLEGGLGIPDFVKILCSQNSRINAFTTPVYSAYPEESARDTYFLLDQQIGLDPNINTKHEVDFLSFPAPTQSESVYPMRSNCASTV